MSTVMFIAGEASGDTNAAAVINELRRQAPELTIFGAGGPKMRTAGMEQIFDLTQHAVVGLVEVLKNYGKFKKLFDWLLKEVEERKPVAVVLVDFPGFNLRFAKAVKKRFPQTKVIYYISPQLWAWHASRAKQIERDVNLMLVIFPFEKPWYARHAPKLHVEFAGHPLADRLKGEGGQQREEKTVLLLPGSRVREVEKIFPIMTKVVEALPDVKFIAAAVNDQTAEMMRHPRVTVEIGTARQWMQRATLTITASGTATMECAFAGCPMIVVYKVNWLTYLVGRAVVRVNWLGMPNVIAGREIVPEFIQYAADPMHIAALTGELIGTPELREVMQAELAMVVKSLDGPGASERAARLILEELK